MTTRFQSSGPCSSLHGILKDNFLAKSINRRATGALLGSMLVATTGYLKQGVSELACKVRWRLGRWQSGASELGRGQKEQGSRAIFLHHSKDQMDEDIKDKISR